MPKIARREVYTIHMETYEFEITPETVKAIEDNYNNYCCIDNHKIENLTEQEVIDSFKWKNVMADSREARICDAVNNYFWDECDYKDDFLYVDDTEPFNDYIVGEEDEDEEN